MSQDSGSSGDAGQPLRRNRSFQLLWGGQAASTLGTEITRLAIPLLILAVTSDAALAGLVTALGVAVMLLVQLPAGVWVDRWGRRRTLLITQAVLLINAVALFVPIALGTATIWNLALFAAVDGACRAFLGPSIDVAIRAVVPDRHLTAAYAQEESRKHAARLAGPSLGGLLYGAATALPFAVHAAGQAVALACSIGAKVPHRPPPIEADPESRPGSMVREAGQAAGWLLRRAGLRELVAVVMVLNLLGGAFSIPLIVLVSDRGGSATTVGIVMAGIGIGGLIGALASARIVALLPAGWFAITVALVFGVTMVATTLPFGALWPLVPITVFSMTTPALNVAAGALIAQLVPRDMLGRIGAALTVSAFALSPAGPALGGLLAEAIGPAPTLQIVGGLSLLVGIVAMRSRALRSFRGDTA